MLGVLYTVCLFLSVLIFIGLLTLHLSNEVLGRIEQRLAEIGFALGFGDLDAAEDEETSLFDCGDRDCEFDEERGACECCEPPNQPSVTLDEREDGTPATERTGQPLPSPARRDRWGIGIHGWGRGPYTAYGGLTGMDDQTGATFMVRFSGPGAAGVVRGLEREWDRSMETSEPFIVIPWGFKGDPSLYEPGVVEAAMALLEDARSIAREVYESNEQQGLSFETFQRLERGELGWLDGPGSDGRWSGSPAAGITGRGKELRARICTDVAAVRQRKAADPPPV